MTATPVDAVVGIAGMVGEIAKAAKVDPEVRKVALGNAAARMSRAERKRATDRWERHNARAADFEYQARMHRAKAADNSLGYDRWMAKALRADANAITQRKSARLQMLQVAADIPPEALALVDQLHDLLDGE